MSAMNDDDWWHWRRDAIEALQGLMGYEENVSLMHLSTKTLRNISIMVHDGVEMSESQLERWETIIENLDYAIGYEEDYDDPRKRNHNYDGFPRFYYE